MNSLLSVVTGVLLVALCAFGAAPPQTLPPPAPVTTTASPAAPVIQPKDRPVEVAPLFYEVMAVIPATGGAPTQIKITYVDGAGKPQTITTPLLLKFNP